MFSKAKFFIIVLYKCNIKDSVSFKSVKESLERESEKAYLYVYDNSPQNQIIDSNDPVWVKTCYIHDPHNSGLGVAYNSGAKMATQLGLQWLILLDQDTDFPVDFIKKLNLAIRHFDDIKLFAPMLKLKSGVSFSPTRYKFKVGHFVDLKEGVLSLKKYSPVNSGMVINTPAFNAVGGYLENVKLDFADFQFIERFRQKYEYFYLINCIATQNYSKEEKDLNKNVFRFKLYLDSVQHCVRKSFVDDFLYFIIVFKHMVAVCIKCKSLIFVRLFYIKYIKNIDLA